MIAKIFIVAAVMAAVVSAAGDVSITECKSADCKAGCRTLGKIPEGECHHRPFSKKEESFKVLCGPAPNAMCAYIAIFNESKCAVADTDKLGYEQIGNCFENHHMKAYEIWRNGNKTGELDVSVMCNKGCSTCKHTYHVAEKTCVKAPHGNFYVGFSSPAKCNPSITSFHYNGSTTCTGTPMVEKLFEHSCYSRMPGRSHYYSCS